MNNAKVLVADDDANVRNVMARALEADAAQVVTARDGRQALALTEDGGFDLAVLDVHMPEADGWEVLESLRANAATRLMPVILVTSDPAQDEAQSLDLGADDFLAKPFSPRELAARVRALLRRHRLSFWASPLTGLPGAPAIEQEVERKVAAREPFALFHVDLDRFKTFNDAFGFARGNEVLRDTAELLRRCAVGGFVGHVGGDDFAVVVDATDAALAAQRMTSLFDAMAPTYYEKGEAPQDRLTLSAGIVSTNGGQLDGYARAAELASEMKSYLKARRPNGLSAFAFDRRRR